MQENKKKTLAILFILIVLFSMTAVTYAFFAGGVSNTDQQTATITTGTMELTFADNDNGVAGQLNFGDSITKLFTLENTGSLDATINLYWKDLVNSYLPGSLMYKLEYSTTQNGEKTIAVNYAPVPTNNVQTSELATQQTVPAGDTYYYTLTITLVNSKTINQTADLEASFASGFTIESAQKYPTLAASDTWYQGSVARSTITKINIVESAEASVIANAEESWPAAVDADGDGAFDEDIMCYRDGTIVTISGEGSEKITLSADASYTFSDKNASDYYTSLTNINGLDKLETSKATDMSYMFRSAIGLTVLDLNSWNTNNLTTIRGMFGSMTDIGTMKFKTLNISEWNVSNVTSMIATFQNCIALASLNVSNWDISNVNELRNTFYGCIVLEDIDVSKWDVSNVTNMKSLFYNCVSLTRLNLTNWDVSKVEDMSFMFASNNPDDPMILTSLGNISSWDISNVTIMNAMFQNCMSLEAVDVSNWDTSSVSNMSYMFKGCSSLTQLNVSNWNVSSVTTMAHMFYKCSSLTNIIGIENWTINSAVIKTDMFTNSGFTSYPDWYFA